MLFYGAVAIVLDGLKSSLQSTCVTTVFTFKFIFKFNTFNALATNFDVCKNVWYAV